MSNKNRKLVTTSTSLYELNKINMAQIQPVELQWLKEKCLEVAKEIRNCLWTNYWMLMCRERYDFTMFHSLPHLEDFSSELADALYECLTNRGDVIDFTKQLDGNYEIWIRDTETKENFAYYLFDYNNGVIEI